MTQHKPRITNHAFRSRYHLSSLARVAAGQSVRDVSRCLESNHAHSELFPTGVDCGREQVSRLEGNLRSIGTLVLIDVLMCVGMDTYTTAQSLDWYGLLDDFGRMAVGSVDTARNAVMRVLCTCAGSTCDTVSVVLAQTTNRQCRQISARYTIGSAVLEYCGLQGVFLLQDCACVESGICQVICAFACAFEDFRAGATPLKQE